MGPTTTTTKAVVGGQAAAVHNPNAVTQKLAFELTKRLMAASAGDLSSMRRPEVLFEALRSIDPRITEALTKYIIHNQEI
jgi:hypothetical protein